VPATALTPASRTSAVPPARDAAGLDVPLAFSICTLVTDATAYAAMRESFAAHGFTADRAEYLFLDNTAGNRWDAYAGIPVLLAGARGRHVILCHQDVRLIGDGAAALAERLAALDRLAPCWAVAGNAGRTAQGGWAMRISDPHGEDVRRGALPARVTSLDENFLVLRRDAPVGLSRDLSGFDLYGTDLCLQAALAGRSSWVIDFHLRHLSGGQVGPRFRATQRALEARYAALAALPRRVPTTCTTLRLPGGPLSHRLWAWRWRRRPG
jgi:hypothetical protein